MISEILSLSTTVQVWLGAGYVAYCTAYAGFRRHHQVRDTIFGIAVFTAIASLAHSFVEPKYVRSAYAASVVVPLLSAMAWRKFGKNWWLKLMSASDVHREDGVSSTWESLVQTDKGVTQCSVHTKDGRILYLNDRPSLIGKAEWNGLYLGGDGSLLMVIEEEEFPDGRTEQRQGVLSDWGARLSYIPASEISQVNFRIG